MITRKFLEKMANQELCEALLNQQEAHLELVKALQCRIAFLEREIEGYDNRHLTCLDFFDSRPELIKPYVEFVYAAIDESREDRLSREQAEDEVRYFHDTSLDLSTLPCTGSDFTPWKD